MKGTFSIKKEIEIDYRDFITTLLCDGTYMFSGYGIEVGGYWDGYNDAKSKLESPCFEDVLTQMILDGESISFKDVEGEGEMSAELSLDKIDKALWKFLDEQPDDAFTLSVQRVLDGDYDVYDTDLILQYILYGEVIFG